MSVRGLIVLACLLLPAMVLAQGSPASQCGLERFQMTLVPNKDIQQQLREFRPLQALLADGLGVPVNILPASSYDGVIDAIVAGGVDMALMGPAAYIKGLRSEPRLEPFASIALLGGTYTPQGSSYYSLLLVRKGSGFRELEDLRGSRVALGDPSSTSGNLVPRALVPDLVGTDFNRFFGSQVYTGGHDRALDALLGDRVDAAFASSTRLDDYLRHGLAREDSLRVIWRSVPLHYDPFVFAAHLCEPVREQVRTLMTTPSARLDEFLGHLSASAVTPVDHDAYRIVEKLVPMRR